MNKDKQSLKKLGQIGNTKMETKPEELAEDLPNCFLLALKYISEAKKVIYYDYLFPYIFFPYFEKNCFDSGADKEIRKAPL